MIDKTDDRQRTATRPNFAMRHVGPGRLMVANTKLRQYANNVAMLSRNVKVFSRRRYELLRLSEPCEGLSDCLYLANKRESLETLSRF